MTQTKTKLIVFDLDGTLLDTIHAIAYHVNNTLADYGLERIPVEKVNAFVGNSSRYLVNHAIDESLEQMAKKGTDQAFLPEISKEKAEEIFLKYNGAYLADPVRKTLVYDGIESLLQELKTRGYALGIFSNKPDAIVQKVVQGLLDAKQFDYIRGQRDDTPRKPDPAGLLQMMDEAGVKKDEVWYLGDTDVDMAVGSAAAVRTIAVTWGFRTAEELEGLGAWKMIDHPRELLELLDGSVSN